MGYSIILIGAIAIILFLFTGSKKSKRTGKQQKKINTELIETADFITIDFETATKKRSSACAVAVVFVKDDEIIGHMNQLIMPPGNEYSKMNISIHGIRPKDTKHSPTFEKVWKGGLDEIIESGIDIAAHNAKFDMSVLRSSLAIYDINIPLIDAHCTVEIARDLYPDLKNHKLPIVAKHLGIDLDHHDPVSDAIASAKIMMEWRKNTQHERDKLREIKARENRLIARYDTLKKDIAKAHKLEKNAPAESASIYFETIKHIKKIHAEENNDNASMLVPRMPINRISLTLERAKEYKKCVQILHWYQSYADPVGLTSTDTKSINSRVIRVEKRLKNNY